MSNLLIVAAVAAVGVVLFGPGLVATYLLGLRGLAAWALAPAITCALVGLAGTAAPLAGIRWSPWLFVALTVVLAVASMLVGRALPRRPAAVARSLDPTARWTLAGLVLGAASVLAGFARSMPSMAAVPAQPDATYHLNAIRNMLQTGDISSRDGSGFLYGRPHTFYPSTFHGVAVTAGQFVHAQPVVLANALSVISASTVWVLGCVLLCRQIFGRHRSVMVFAGLASASFTAMPYWMGGYGTLWPYLLGLSLVPALLAGILSLLGLAPAGAEDTIGRGRAGVALGVGVVGLPLVHPDAFAALVLVTYVVVVVVVVRRLAGERGSAGRRPTPGGLARCLAAVLLPLAAGWAVSRSSHLQAMSANYARGPDESLRRAVSEVLVSAPRYSPHLWVTSAVLLVGLVACAVTPTSRRRWVPAAYVVLALVFIGVAAVQSGFTRSITVYWYNDSPRLGAMLALAGVPALTAGLLALTRLTTAAGKRLRGNRLRSSPHAVAIVVTVVFVVATLGNNQAAHVSRLRPYYSPADSQLALLPAAAPRAFAVLARSIPAGALVAENPWRGNALLYAFTGHRVVFYSEKALSTADAVLLATDLYRAGTSAGGPVCAAVHRVGVGYVLTGGTNRLKITGHRNDFSGIDQVAGSVGFTRVATSGAYTLWRITGCE